MNLNLIFRREIEEILLDSNSAVGYNGQPVGIILADTFALANYAAKFVSITYMKTGRYIFIIFKTFS